MRDPLHTSGYHPATAVTVAQGLVGSRSPKPHVFADWTPGRETMCRHRIRWATLPGVVKRSRRSTRGHLRAGSSARAKYWFETDRQSGASHSAATGPALGGIRPQPDQSSGIAFGRVERPDPDRRIGQSGRADSRSALWPNPVDTRRLETCRNRLEVSERSAACGGGPIARRAVDILLALGGPETASALIRKRQWRPSE